MPIKSDDRLAHLELATHVTPKQPFTFDTGVAVVTETVEDPRTGELVPRMREEATWETLNPGEVFRVDHPYVVARPEHFKPVTSSREDVEVATAVPGEKRGRRAV